MADTQIMNKGFFSLLTALCGAFAAMVATGGDAAVYVERLAANLPL